MSQKLPIDDNNGGPLALSQSDASQFTPLALDDSSIQNFDPKFLYSFYLASNYYPKHTKETNARNMKLLLEQDPVLEY